MPWQGELRGMKSLRRASKKDRPRLPPRSTRLGKRDVHADAFGGELIQRNGVCGIGLPAPGTPLRQPWRKPDAQPQSFVPACIEPGDDGEVLAAARRRAQGRATAYSNPVRSRRG